MSKSNPESSIKALFPAPIPVGNDVCVYPLSLGHYALLEKIDSYLVNGDHLPDSIEVIKTMYICTHTAKEVLDDFDNLGERAFDWAESLPPVITKSIMDAIKEQIDAMMKVIPVVDDNGKKKAIVETDS